jgi:hypothetical protein
VDPEVVALLNDRWKRYERGGVKCRLGVGTRFVARSAIPDADVF